MRVGLVVAQHHHDRVVGQFDVGEPARRALGRQRVGATRHRQQDVEGLAPLAGFGDVVDQRAGEAPVIGRPHFRGSLPALSPAGRLARQPDQDAVRHRVNQRRAVLDGAAAALEQARLDSTRLDATRGALRCSHAGRAPSAATGRDSLSLDAGSQRKVILMVLKE